MKRLLLTGATGFIGRYCLPLLLAQDYEVHCVSSGRGSRNDSDGIRWHTADLLYAQSIPNLLARVRPTHLLHLAWTTAPGQYWTSLENVRWVQSSLELLQQFAAHGGQRAVLAGTCAEYDWRNGYCSESGTPLLPKTLYGASKHALQILTDSFAKQAGISSAWGRIFFLYGQHEHPERLVSYVIRSILQREPVLCSHGEQVRDFLYVKDVAAAFVALLESDVRGAVNIASGEAVSLKDLIQKIADKLYGRELVRLGAVETSSDEPPLLVAATERLRDEVGWSPVYNLDKGLEETIDWWKEILRRESVLAG
ncbi:MAG TPA: NAD(P)-dependent oxidoreductase [Pyrinomonadaceae bacterium]|nr:NAD(P)-dependent oxidoreductase [Pyrinomonadaceae bacterium]